MIGPATAQESSQKTFERALNTHDFFAGRARFPERARSRPEKTSTADGLGWRIPAVAEQMFRRSVTASATLYQVSLTNLNFAIILPSGHLYQHAAAFSGREVPPHASR